MMKALGIAVFLALVAAATNVPAQTGTLSFSSTTYLVSDTATSVAVVVVFVGGATNDTPSVTFATADGTAFAGLDYVATTQTVSFAAGALLRSVSIPILTDGSLDENVTVNLSLLNAEGAFLGGVTNATLTIVASGGGGNPVPAGSHVFPVKINGVFTEFDGTKTKFKSQDLVTDGQLVLVVEIDDHKVALGQLDSDNNLEFLAQSTTAAFFTNGVFGANLAFEDFALAKRAAGLAFGATQVFPLKMTGILAAADGTKYTVGTPSLAGKDRLVLVLDADNYGVGLGVLDADDDITMLGASQTAAILPGGYFAANLTFEDVALVNNDVNIIGTGDLQIKGRLREVASSTRVSKIILEGVFNDSINGNPNDEDALLKARLTPGKEITTPVGILDDTINNGGASNWQIKGTIFVDDDGVTRLLKATVLGSSADDTLIKATVVPAGKEYNIDSIGFPDE